MQGIINSRGIIQFENGWRVLVDKPSKWTSFDVVAKIRSITGIKRAGHAGSLDPMATGLLVVALGKQTKFLSAGLEGDKSYKGMLKLGACSLTWDADAPWTINVDPPVFEESRIVEGLEFIRNSGTQVPPMYAAIKREGHKLYSLARKGWWIEREPRPVKINSLNLLNYDTESNTVEIEVSGAGGLYVRSIAHDLGIFLGLPVLLSELRRTGVGEYSVDDALTLEQLEEEWKNQKK